MRGVEADRTQHLQRFASQACSYACPTLRACVPTAHDFHDFLLALCANSLSCNRSHYIARTCHLFQTVDLRVWNLQRTHLLGLVWSLCPIMPGKATHRMKTIWPLSSCIDQQHRRTSVCSLAVFIIYEGLPERDKDLDIQS